MTKKWLQAYFKGENPSPDDLPLAERGTAFQRRVWLALSEIPMGQIRTYGQIGKAISCQSAQAVGTAVSKNLWLILITCHRVLPSSDHLGNYAAGEDAKCFLLCLEGLRFDKSYIDRLC